MTWFLLWDYFSVVFAGGDGLSSDDVIAVLQYFIREYSEGANLCQVDQIKLPWKLLVHSENGSGMDDPEGCNSVLKKLYFAMWTTMLHCKKEPAHLLFFIWKQYLFSRGVWEDVNAAAESVPTLCRVIDGNLGSILLKIWSWDGQRMDTGQTDDVNHRISQP